MIKIIEFILRIFGINKKEKDNCDSIPNDELKNTITNTQIQLEKMFMKRELVVNNSDGKDYYKQTNNEIDPYISCFPSSMINAASVINLQFPTDKEHTGGYKQPEDAFNWFLEHNPECIEFYNRPAYKSYVNTKGNHPRELYDVEVFAFNKWMGKTVCEVKYGCTVSDIVNVLNYGGAVVTSGNFCGFGHVVCIVGFKCTIEPGKVTDKDVVDGLTHFIVDDSYGNPHDRYKPLGIGGNDVVWEREAFLTAINKGSVNKPVYNMISFRRN